MVFYDLIQTLVLQRLLKDVLNSKFLQKGLFLVASKIILRIQLASASPQIILFLDNLVIVYCSK